METVVTIFGYNLTYLELIGSIFNLVSVILATKVNWGNWITSILGQICFFFLFWNNQLYFYSLLQVYFTGVCIMAIYYWNKTEKENHEGLKWFTNNKRFLWGMITSFTIIITYFITKQIIPTDKQSEYLFLDVTITVLSILGVNLLSLKIIDAWIVWLIIDVLSICLFWLSGMYIVSIEYIVITFIAFFGLLNWMKIYKLKTIC